MHFKSIPFAFYIVLAISLLGCLAHPPSSVYPGIYSATTGVSVRNSRVEHLAKGINDFDVIHYKSNRKICADTFTMTDLSVTIKSMGVPGAPGILVISTTGLGIDEAEVSNLEWKYYQEQSIKLTEANDGLTQPSITALPTKDYFTDPFYNRFPVVGISYEQAVAFCQWRSRTVTNEFNRGTIHSDSSSTDYVKFDYRLPTEAEWEKAALVERRIPFGTTCTQLPIQVNPIAAAYLKRRSGSAVNSNQIKEDIIAYNQSKPIRSWISCRQSEPYFLQLASPVYVWQGPPNDFGLYQLLGNAAELVQEKGVTKGGSYLDPIEACTVNARGAYTGPAQHIGFRCVCEVSYPNRK